jgi:HD-GYP domain-containing protein (c-di-GMP phosphodiesterase class II)
MTTTRSYRRAMPVSAALAELRDNAGTQFDQRVVDALVRVVGRPAEDSADAAGEEMQ